MDEKKLQLHAALVESALGFLQGAQLPARNEEEAATDAGSMAASAAVGVRVRVLDVPIDDWIESRGTCRGPSTPRIHTYIHTCMP